MSHSTGSQGNAVDTEGKESFNCQAGEKPGSLCSVKLQMKRQECLVPPCGGTGHCAPMDLWGGEAPLWLGFTFALFKLTLGEHFRVAFCLLCALWEWVFRENSPSRCYSQLLHTLCERSLHGANRAILYQLTEE